jgi:hypothetical protein
MAAFSDGSRGEKITARVAWGASNCLAETLVVPLAHKLAWF